MASVTKTFRLTPQQMDMLIDTRSKPPFPANDSEALRVICDRAKGVEPVHVVAGLAQVEQLQIFHRDVVSLLRTAANLRSCLPGDLNPDTYSDDQMRKVIKTLRAQALALPEQLGFIRGQSLRMADLLGIGLTPNEAEAIRHLQVAFRGQILQKEVRIGDSSGLERRSAEKYYASVEQASGILDRLFGPPPGK
jgi:hypothetical protein